MIVDAYCHVGLPRFGSVENTIATAKVFGINQSVLVLGPMVPDYESLFRAIHQYPDRVRGIGIPFGDNERQQTEVADIQVRAGISGIRLSGDEILAYPSVPDLFGLAGRWIYAVGLINNPPAAEALLDWLERYQSSRIAAPHFLRPTADPISPPLAELISHSRFHPIFSRHGGLGSQTPYPHEDLKPWVESVVSLCGWGHIMFGSEFPVIFWRDETMQSCLDWIRDLSVDVGDEQADAFLGKTAKRLLFDRPSPEREDVDIPAWVDQFDRTRTVPLWDGREVSMNSIESWHNVYINELKENPKTKFSESSGNPS